MKDKLLRDIELKLSLQFPAEQREKAMQVVISCLNDYDVTERVTDLTVRHEDINERILKKYVACIRIDGKAESTIKQYVRTLIKLAELIGKPYTEMSAYDIRYFLGDIKEHGAKNSYVENQRSYVSAFFQWMLDEEIIQKNACAKVKTIKVEAEIKLPFSAVEIDKMRAACVRPLDRAMIETMLSSGVRREELCNLKVSDVDLDKRILTVRHGKGGKDRIVYISDVAAMYLLRYFADRKDDLPSLFVGKGTERMTPGGVRALLKRLEQKSGVENVHPHRFRRTLATNLINHGMGIQEVAVILGHDRLETTMKYLYITEDNVRNSYHKYA